MKNTRISLKTINGRWCVNNGIFSVTCDTFVDAMRLIDLCYKAVK